MIFEKLLTAILDLTKNNNYDKALDLIMENYNLITTTDLADYFSKFDNIYLLSGSGGSGICKPNLTTILAIHVNNIAKANFSTHPINIVKTGSRKVTSLSGSTDFISKLNSVPFNYIDETNFNKAMNILKIIPCVRYYCENNLISSVLYRKRIIFSCKANDNIKNTISNSITKNKDIVVITSELNQLAFDEVNPEKYTVISANSTTQKTFKSNYEFICINKSNIDYYNEMLLFGNFNNFWGNCLKYELVECISYFFNLDFDTTIALINNYQQNFVLLIYFDGCIGEVEKYLKFNGIVDCKYILFSDIKKIESLRGKYMYSLVISVSKTKICNADKCYVYQNNYMTCFSYLMRILRGGI